MEERILEYDLLYLKLVNILQGNKTITYQTNYLGIYQKKIYKLTYNFTEYRPQSIVVSKSNKGISLGGPVSAPTWH